MGVDPVMWAVLNRRASDAEIRHWSYRLGEAFGPECFWVWRTGEPGGVRHILSRQIPRQEDGEVYGALPESIADTDVLKVSLATRYYGEGYERGDLPTIIAVADFIEAALPVRGPVWYGGDCDDHPKPWPPSARRTAFLHFARVGHQPYVGAFDRDVYSAAHCLFCDAPMISTWRNGRAVLGYRCAGCALEIGSPSRSMDDGKVFTRVGGPFSQDVDERAERQAEVRQWVRLPVGARWAETEATVTP